MMEVQRVDKKQKKKEEEEAALTSPDSSVTRTPRRALRGRGATRANSAAPPASSPDTNGSPSEAGSGRVLRDRSMRSVPVWRRRDLGVEQGDDDEEEEEEDEEEEEGVEARRRRKTACPRRRRNTEAARDSSRAQCGESKDAAGAQGAGGSRRVQSRSKAAVSRGSRGSARVVCKSEPEAEPENTCAEENRSPEKKKSTEKKTEVKEDEVLLDEEDPPITGDLKDQAYKPQAQSEDVEGVSSDEDMPFKDDLNDQSYNPKSGRESQKPRRRAPPRSREKKEKAAGGEKDKEKEMEVKTEGGEMTDVKQEAGEGVEPPRKRGRRRKDDKSPRLPKRRKKPPVQYVRCEMEGCGTVLAHPRYLQHHIKYQHLMKKKYVCPHPSCGRLFRLQKQLLRHAKHHTDQRDYICEFCARAFKSSHNLAVHRMIHTGEKPLQCEICGFTCRQKASLNWHMKKHDADASYQFSCAICGKKFEKKDSVVAHKAKSHPEVLIAEALAANAGALVTTTTPNTTHVTSVGICPVMLLDQEQSLHGMQVPVTLGLPLADEAKSEAEGGGASVSHSTSSGQTLHFVSAPVSQQQLSVQASPQIVHMTLATLSNPPQQLPLLSVTHQLPPSTSSTPSGSLLPQVTSVAFSTDPVLPPSSPTTSPPPPSQAERKEGGALWEGGTGNVGVVWEVGGAGEAQVMTDGSDGTIQHRLM